MSINIFLKPFYKYISALVAVLLSLQSTAGDYKWLVLNSRSGLPSDNVYTLAVDRHGYLWIATDKGVAVYNGFEVRQIELPATASKDVWMMHEDARGRMWLFSISNSIGYVKGGRYHKVYCTRPGVIYPHMPVDWQGGIAFISTIIESSLQLESHTHYLCVEQNDTITPYSLVGHNSLLFAASNTRVIELSQVDSCLRWLTVTPQGTLLKRSIPTQSAERTVGVVPAFFKTIPLLFDHYILGYNAQTRVLYALDTTNGKYISRRLSDITISAPGEAILGAHTMGGKLAIITQYRVLLLDSELAFLSQFSWDNGPVEDPSWFLDDKLWGRVIASRSRGVFIPLQAPDVFAKGEHLLLEDFRFAGKGGGKGGYWWSAKKKLLMHVDEGKITASYNSGSLKQPRIIACSNGGSMMLSEDGIYILKDKGTLRKIADVSAFDGHANGDTELYFIQKFRTFRRVNIRTGSTELIDAGRYTGLAFDKLRNRYLVYGDRKILVYTPGTPPEMIGEEQLLSLGIDNIKKILVDSVYGNIVVVSEDKIQLFADLHHKGRQIFGEYVLNGAHVALSGPELSVSGKFGALFAEIESGARATVVYTAWNIANRFYNEVIGMQPGDGSVLLSTDSGAYIINNRKGQQADLGFQTCELLVRYKGVTRSLRQTDTILLSPDDARLTFDVIRRLGAGHVHYRYRPGGNDAPWSDLDNDELTLQGLLPGVLYSLALQAADDQWRSSVKTIYIYIPPQWYQTAMGQIVITACIVLLFVLAVYRIVAVTKRRAIRQSENRNRQLELELKAVYSQLNPHFIFNSLNGALYLVKTRQFEQAYNHIHKFSQLMRSYIASSRNRSISLRDEIVNLRNYIELQQDRFRDKFEYSIAVSDDVEQSLRIPSLLLQPIVENAIIHGLLHKEGAGHLSISFEMVEKSLVCTIDDDGIGREQARMRREHSTLKSESYGGDLLKDLGDILKRYEKITIEIRYIDKQPPFTGTTVVVTVNSHEI